MEWTKYHIELAIANGANLTYSDLRGANLRGANLIDTDLTYSDLRGANLRYADLVGADLRDANLGGANLRDANLRGANLRYADLVGADLPAFQICPEKGSFTAWKSCHGRIVELVILGKRTSSLIGRKCRTNKALVISITSEFVNVTNEAVSYYDKEFVYKVNQVVEEPEYNDDIRIDCTPGIHFYMTRKEAVESGF